MKQSTQNKICQETSAKDILSALAEATYKGELTFFTAFTLQIQNTNAEKRKCNDDILTYFQWNNSFMIVAYITVRYGTLTLIFTHKI